MAKKKIEFKLGEYYFNYQSRNCVIQSVWMMGLWEDLYDEYHLRQKDEFPPEFTNDNFQIGGKYVCKKWEEECRELHEKMLSSPELKGFHPYFADDPIKEGALGFFITTAGYIDGKQETPFLEEKYAENKNSFYVQSRCYYLLSLCYKYFFEIQQAIEEEFGITIDECFLALDQIKEGMWYATGDILAYWSIVDKRRRLCAKVGLLPKGSNEILNAVVKLIQKNCKTWKASDLWTHFRLNAEEYDLVFEKDYTDNGEDRIVDLDGKGITFGTFRRYVAKAKNTQRKIVAQ